MKHSLIKYSKDLEWLIPFVNSVKSIVPTYKIKSIKSYKVQKGLTERHYGTIYKSNGAYTINLKIYTYSKKQKKYANETYEGVLLHLAHELAHTKEWEHTYKHFKIQALILLKFSSIIKKNKINDTSEGFNN